MLQTAQSTVSSNSVLDKMDKQLDIVKKLEELNKWQEEQKKLLQAKQSLQRQMLGMEQQNMYEMLGLQNESEMSLVEDLPEGDKGESSVVKGSANFEVNEVESTAEISEANQLDGEDMVELQKCKEIEPNSHRALTSGYDTEHCTEKTQTRPKRSFLKRGEGLKKRFKIDPDELRLTKLPKYKYANAHPRLRLKPLNKIKDLKTKSSNQTNATATNKIPAKHLTTLDIQEQRFQNLLISCKNTCSSTPDTKSSLATNKVFSATAKDKIIDGKSILSPEIGEVKYNDATKTQTVNTLIVAWSKILDPLEIHPLEVPRNHIQTLPQTEESIFELLEQKAGEGSIDMDSTCLKEFMTRPMTEILYETDDNIPVHENLKSKRLEPVILAKNSQVPSCYSSDEEEESQLTEDVESSELEETTHKTIETTNSSYRQQPQVRVRFSDSNETHEYEEEAKTSFNDTCRLSAGTSPEGHEDTSNDELFAQFKEALFAALHIKANQHLPHDSTLNSDSNVTLTPKDSNSTSNNCENNNFSYSPSCEELQEKTDMIKLRLAELEKEIQNFKDNNILLMKAKQDHELQKSICAQEHLEAMESIKDEKIRMEIYLHDERVKLEDEKRQFEQNMKMKSQGLVAKKHKEYERLKEQVMQLEMQLKSKETNHTTAQARLRSQIRNLEREQSKLHEQIEHLTRENKRLENENLKISRDQNNKILLEINRNIAKLAPKQIKNSSDFMPEEGPPTLGTSRTVSKCIIAAAAANKKSGKAYMTTGTRLSKAKPGINKKPLPQRHEKEETTLEARFLEENEQQQPQQENNITDNEEDDGYDILREFQMTPEKRNNIPTTNQKNVSNNSPRKLLRKGQDYVPVPPPSSPRSSGGYSNKMKREIENADGSKDIWYPNGNLKKIAADGMIIRMLYYNKDIKETNINDGTVKYYYAETNTWHTTYLDGLEILEFPNGQIEHRHKSGIVEVHYPNNSIKIIDPKDEYKQEEWRFHDGTHLVHMRNGDKILSLPNGQKEIHNRLHKRREYPDGTVKIVYPDGSTETRYSNGRVRLKDKEGNLVMDTDMAK